MAANSGNHLMKPVYSAVEFAIGAGGVVDYDVKANEGGWDNVPGVFDGKWHSVIIRTNATITIKFNDAANNVITLTAAEGTFVIGTLAISNIFITSAGAANIKITLA